MSGFNNIGASYNSLYWWLEKVDYSNTLDPKLVEILEWYNDVISKINSSNIFKLFKESLEYDPDAYYDVIMHLLNWWKIFMILVKQIWDSYDAISFDWLSLDNILQNWDKYLSEDDYTGVFMSKN